MTQQETSAVKVRQLTLCNKHFARVQNKYVCYPELVLRDSGFRAGHVVDIAYEDGKLTVAIAKEQRFEDV